jgi:hypothetical protein
MWVIVGVFALLALYESFQRNRAEALHAKERAEWRRERQKLLEKLVPGLVLEDVPPVPFNRAPGVFGEYETERRRLERAGLDPDDLGED